jgi:oxidoreductase
MASERESNLERFQKEDHSAFVVGYTGETGKALVAELNETKAFKRVVLIGRRQTNISEKLGEGFVRNLNEKIFKAFTSMIWEIIAS